MIQAVATVIEVIIAVLVASVLFFIETLTNFSPKKNFRKAYTRIRKNIKDYQLD